jgi:hypothetical protein
MKYVFLAILLSACTSHCHAQSDAKTILNKMATLVDQYNKNFDKNAVKDQLIIIYIAGGDDPFQKIYDKLKGKLINSKIPVQFVGGMAELAASHGGGTMSPGHLQEAFIFRYGSSHFPILIDLQSDVGKLLNVKGLSVVTISKSKNKIISSNDYAYDRIKFFKDINQYLK